MISAEFSDLLTPPVRKFMQPPVLRLLTMSAFGGSPPPPSADVICVSPLGASVAELARAPEWLTCGHPILLPFLTFLPLPPTKYMYQLGIARGGHAFH